MDLGSPTCVIHLQVEDGFQDKMLSRSGAWTRLNVSVLSNPLGIQSLTTPSASLATIARIPYARETLHSSDYLYNFTDLAIWSTVEIGLALIASSLATLKPLFRKFNMLDGTKREDNSGVTPANKDTVRSSALHSRKRSIMSLGRGVPRDFGEIEEDESELTAIAKGSRVHLKSVSEIEEPEAPRWDEESQQLGGKVRMINKSTMYREW